MNNSDYYICLYPDLKFSDQYIIEYLETKEILFNLLKKLHSIKTKTNQPLTDYAYVFQKGSLYPVEYDEFWRERHSTHRTRQTLNGSFFIQRIYKNGNVKQKFYEWAEDFDWQFENWKEQNVVVLDTNEAYSGSYVYDRDVIKHWGDKESLFI